MSRRIRPRLWQRILISLTAIVLYAGIAFALVMLIPEASWPAIGDTDHSSAQATVVAALNVFALGAIVLAVLQPVIPATVRVYLDGVVGVAAAWAGPVLARVSNHADAGGLITPGALALGVVAIVVGLVASSMEDTTLRS